MAAVEATFDAPVRIVRSFRRRRSASARVVSGVLEVRVPAAVSAQALDTLVRSFQERFARTHLQSDAASDEELVRRAHELNMRYFAGALRFSGIVYAPRQTSKYGCCNIREKAIRISARLRRMPSWVRDYVIIHELAHLVEPNHGKAFWRLVMRYKRAERARGFLMGVATAESLAGNGEIISR